MQILVITKDLRSIGLASRLVSEGHDVAVSSTVKLPETYGFFTKASHVYNAIKDCKFIVADAVDDQKVYEWAKTFNKPIIGCSPMTDLMNKDCYREYTIGQRLGVVMPPTEVINDMSEMFGKVVDWNPTRTLVRYDRETITCDHQQWLSWAMYKLPLNKKILLQTPSFGEELTVTGWFDGTKWVRPFILKTNKESDLGASLMLGLYEREWTKKVIEPWGEFLRKVDYRGPFTVRALASKQAVQIISTHTGIEFPSIYAYFEGLKEPIGEFLNKIAFGVCDKVDYTSDYISSIVVRTNLKDPEGIPIIGIDSGNSKHLFFGSVRKNEEEIVVMPGPWIYTVTAHGRDPDESFGRAYHTNTVVRVPEPSYATNMSSVYKPWLNKLKNLELI